MRRVLVPLDGTDFAASVLPDAQRLAGRDGTLILVHVATEHEQLDGEDYLTTLSAELRREGIAVEDHALRGVDAASTVDAAAGRYAADAIAIATHALSAAERWRHGSIAWRAMIRSTVPILFRHVGPDAALLPQPERRRLLVPLDGSPLAELAVPLGASLAAEWSAPLTLAHVLTRAAPPSASDGRAEAERYLRSVATAASAPAEVEVRTGPVVDQLAALVAERSITDVVMTSLGRTAAREVIIGAVAGELIHRLRCPILVLPPLLVLESTSAAG
ncbi:MAG TPA: universal stress protein [Chloroflexota bacterium]|nr:universal stress protein [Chloroflexota bacterium]